MIVQRLTARRRKKILLKQNRKKTAENSLSGIFIPYLPFSASESVRQPSIAHFTLAGIWEISMCAEASSRLSRNFQQTITLN